MSAVTHTEIYRRFDGELQRRAFRFVPIFLSDVRVATRRKLPLILFYAPPAIAGIVISFLVYAKFTVEAGAVDGELGLAQLAAASLAQRLIEVHRQIVDAVRALRAFALLVIAWFGAGLIAEDRRLGAHLLYFSRPLTRLDYFLGHFCTVAFFGLCAVLGPVLLICIVATFSSPEYAFLKQQGDVVVAAVGYALLYVTTLSAFVLAVSSLAKRKTIALVIVFGIMVASEGTGGVLSELERNRDFHILGLWSNFERLGNWMLGAHNRFLDWDPRWSLVAVGALLVLSLAICAVRIQRLEVVA